MGTPSREGVSLDRRAGWARGCDTNVPNVPEKVALPLRCRRVRHRGGARETGGAGGDTVQLTVCPHVGSDAVSTSTWSAVAAPGQGGGLAVACVT